ncbi:four helix bundle protein [Flavobacterium sp. HSC-61S13]|uniref:four helix bundle protein n=1 Tax=Flavobacterium sp. HSC-61S13 TaxID=2910963 RepID=UPI00209D497C|nr:four helix bundle protein [Flavobacterium sp. HSC-61S13]MCP1997185.1 four helix bundle protein [Flavobacterium sp. HSC-61S13]
MKTHRNLDVWNKSIQLVTDIYMVTKAFPREEVYGLTNQIRRSAISIPSNISEGSARKGSKEYIQFLYIALGSKNELETQVIIAFNLDFISLEQQEDLLFKIENIGKMLSGLIKYVKSKEL